MRQRPVNDASGGATGWLPFDKGSSLGKVGSEDGLIVRDEVHPAGARLTLEKETFPAPCSVTCSIYGWLAHTCYYDGEASAQAAFDAMKPEVAAILLLLSGDNDPEGTAFLTARRAIEGFVERFPRISR